MTSNPIPADIREQAQIRDNWACQFAADLPMTRSETVERWPGYDVWTVLSMRVHECAGPLVLHHRNDAGLGGRRIHKLDLLVHLCDNHHKLVHAHPAESRAVGLLIRD